MTPPKQRDPSTDPKPPGELYPAIEPHETGMLAVGDGHAPYYEVSGSPKGKPALFPHGGSGSGTDIADPGIRRALLAATDRFAGLD